MLSKFLTPFTIFAIMSGAAIADTKPWEMAKPAGMTGTHSEAATAARNVQLSLPNGQFGYDPMQADWDWGDGRNRTIPLSNMSIQDLSMILNNKYHIWKSPESDAWNVRYYSPEGKTFFCEFNNFRKTHFEWIYDRYIETASFGLAGIMHWDSVNESTPKPPEDEAVGYPVVVSGDDGIIFSYHWDGDHWVGAPGWIQEPYAAAFAEKCPNLPRVSNVNNNQLGDTFNDMIREADPVVGIRTMFRNDPTDPLTAGMYYWFNKPE